MTTWYEIGIQVRRRGKYIEEASKLGSAFPQWPLLTVENLHRKTLKTAIVINSGIFNTME